MKKVDSFFQNETLPSKRDKTGNNNNNSTSSSSSSTLSCAKHRMNGTSCTRYKLKSNIASAAASSSSTSSFCSSSQSALMAEAASIAMKVAATGTLAPPSTTPNGPSNELNATASSMVGCRSTKINCYSPAPLPSIEIDSDKVSSKLNSKHITKESSPASRSCSRGSSVKTNSTELAGASNSSSGSGSSSRMEESPKKNNFSSSKLQSNSYSCPLSERNRYLRVAFQSWCKWRWLARSLDL